MSAKKHKLSLVWLRRDMRLKDNKALSLASKESEKVALIFVFDTNILDKLKDKKDQRLTFIYDSLMELNEELDKKGSQLIIKYGDPKKIIPELAKKLQVDALYYNEDYEVYAKNRDKEIKSQLKDVSVQACKDHVVFSGAEVLKNDGTPYQVFTPYKKAWLKKLDKQDIEVQKESSNYIDKKLVKSFIEKNDLKSMGFQKADPYYDFQKPGRKAGVKSLVHFSEFVKNYDEDRDFPFLKNGTSGLSVHLRFGTVSIRECVRMCLKLKGKGAETWLSELIWRDFYAMILDQFPHVEKEAFKAQYKDIKWPSDKKLFKAWCEGETGFPIVDAGMRQLNKTGWMHNRVRMIVASFLVKDLLVNWQLGEAYFAEKLMDFELASNNGGWQWSASTGCDAQPYFRIFNPSRQSSRFDSEAEYIKQWVPELKDCTAKQIHNPEESELHKKADYPQPIVDHSAQRVKAVALFKN